MRPEVKAYLTKHASEYAHLKKITGAGEYPFTDNRCGRCRQVSDQPLIPSPAGWACGPCCYGKGFEDERKSV